MDYIPMINFLWVEEGFRREGRGSALIRLLEEETSDANVRMILACTPSNEDTQNFFRRIGFVDSGGLAFLGDPLELLMIKYQPNSIAGSPRPPLETQETG